MGQRERIRAAQRKYNQSAKGKAARRRWSLANKAKHAASTRRWRYGIAPAEYDALLARQDGKCAICRETPNGEALSVDHNHHTGAVRGLLCRQCNAGIGLFNEDPNLIRQAIAYVGSHRATH